MNDKTLPTTPDGIPVELASERKIRYRNKVHYRFSHWPIWIFVFFIMPGPLTFDLFESGVDRRMLVWLGTVMVATGIAGLRGRLPGCEPRPYIIRFTEDRPNPLYRRVCYTFAWSAVVTFGVLNIAGLAVAIVTSFSAPMDWPINCACTSGQRRSSFGRAVRPVSSTSIR